MTHEFTSHLLHRGNLFVAVTYAIAIPMCEHCDAVDSVLANVLGRKPTDVVMKRVRAKLHGPQLESAVNLTATS